MVQPQPISLTAKQALEQVFGYSSFRGHQEAIVDTLMRGENAFVVMPTGGGKSLCYQLPALLMPGTALVISPLIALMKNQVDQLRQLGIPASYLNSSVPRAQAEQVKADLRAGKQKLLYIAPETLSRPDTQDLLAELNLSFLAVDEAHCISEWGHDFRPEYRRIRAILNEIKPELPIVALTATATPKVIQDILNNLQIPGAQVFSASFNRPNLYYEVRPKGPHLDTELIRYVKQQQGGCGIIYCLSRRKVEEIARLLNLNGVSAVPYHAGLDAETRGRHQDAFLQEEVQVVVATIAFGMGIDKRNVRFVVHYDVPKSLESYYQETGRAGRDGEQSHCLLYYQPADLQKLDKFMRDKPLNEREAGRVLLDEMEAFAESGLCRRLHLLHYFGEHYETSACNGMCDNCTHPRPQQDHQERARQVLRSLPNTGTGYTLQQLVANQHTHQPCDNPECPEEGAQRQQDENDKLLRYRLLINALQLRGYIKRDSQDPRHLFRTPAGAEWMEQQEPFLLPENLRDHHARRKEQAAQPDRSLDTTLLKRLQETLEQVASEKQLPQFVIFGPNAIEEMARRYPRTAKELELLPGVGGGKARRFGKPFLEVIENHLSQHAPDLPSQEDNAPVRTYGKNSQDLVYIIQQVDRRTPLNVIASQRGMSFDQLLDKVDQLVFGGCQLNIGYYVREVVDEDKMEDILDHFYEENDPSVDYALKCLGEDYTPEEVRLVRASLVSEKGN